MASTARDEDDKKEYFDSPEELEKKVSQLAEWVRDSKHMIVFTVSFILLAIYGLSSLITLLPLLNHHDLIKPHVRVFMLFYSLYPHLCNQLSLPGRL